MALLLQLKVRLNPMEGLVAQGVALLLVGRVLGEVGVECLFKAHAREVGRHYQL